MTPGRPRPRKGVLREQKKKSRQPFIVLTGLSGSGKSQAIRALEDLGYFCVDNLPTTLIPTVAKLSIRGDLEKVAIVVDVREAVGEKPLRHGLNHRRSTPTRPAA